MRRVIVAQPGQDVLEAALPNGTPIRGITIDNPSGSWILVSSEKAYCPPYTLGWSLPLSYDQASVILQAGDGPAGQVATTQGDPWQATIDSETTPPSTGSTYQFTSGFTPSSLYYTSGLQMLANSTTIGPAELIPGIPGRRLRIRRVSMYISYITGLSNLTAAWVAFTGGAANFAHVGVDFSAADSVDLLTTVLDYGSGLDLVVGDGYGYNTLRAGGYTVCWYAINIIYEVI